MKQHKFYIIFLSFLILLTGCQKFSEAMTGTKRSKSSDEFFVHKKKPLVLPPHFDEMPSPKVIKEENKIVTKSGATIEDLLNIKKESNKDTFDSKNDQSLEQSILKKIKKN